jgi:hypothetical protein
LNLGQIIVIGLSVTLVLWFAGGTWYNRRRARQVSQWLEAGLGVFGGRAGKVWIASSGTGLRVAVDNAQAPLRRLELIVRLESRENLPLWLFELAQGKRDQLTLRAWLRSAARGEIELAPAEGVFDRALQAETDQPWQRTNAAPHWVIAQRGTTEERQLAALQEFVAAYGQGLQRFSLRRAEPHLFVQLGLRQLPRESSRDLFQRLKTAVTG